MCLIRHIYRMPNNLPRSVLEVGRSHAACGYLTTRSWMEMAPPVERSIFAASVPYRIARVFPTRLFPLNSANLLCAVLHFSRHLRYPCAVQQHHEGRPEGQEAGKCTCTGGLAQLSPAAAPSSTTVERRRDSTVSYRVLIHIQKLQGSCTYSRKPDDIHPWPDMKSFPRRCLESFAVDLPTAFVPSPVS